MRFLRVFLLMTVLDVTYAAYVIAATAHQVIASGAWAAILIVLSGLLTRAYVEDKRLLIPAALGAFVGMAAAVWFF